MKKITASILVSLSLMSCAAFAQTPAPAAAPVAAPAAPALDPATVAAVKELVDVIKYRDMMKGMVAQLGKSMPQMMRQGATQAINGNAKLNDAQKKAALAKMEQTIPEAVDAMTRMFSDPGLMDEMVDELVPLYAGNFTTDEIKQITVFYRSPVGMKTITVMPKIMGEAMQASQRIIMPRMTKAMEKLTQDLTK